MTVVVLAKQFDYFCDGRTFFAGCFWYLFEIITVNIDALQTRARMIQIQSWYCAIFSNQKVDTLGDVPGH